MKVEKIKILPNFPVKNSAWDAIWIFLNERSKPGPFESSVLRDIDWRLQGVLSRFELNKDEFQTEELTYLPVADRLGIRFLIIDNHRSLTRKKLEAVAKGIGARRFLFWPEGEAQTKWLEKQLSSQFVESVSKTELVAVDHLDWGDDLLPRGATEQKSDT